MREVEEDGSRINLGWGPWIVQGSRYSGGRFGAGMFHAGKPTINIYYNP